MKCPPLANEGGNRQAFTFVELLAILVIIGVLAALLFPALGRMREGAKGTQSIANMKQVLNAAALYTGEYGTTLYHRRPIPGQATPYYFQYLPAQYWENSYDALYSPFEKLSMEQKTPTFPLYFPGASPSVPVPSYGMNRQGPKKRWVDENGVGNGVPDRNPEGEFMRPDVHAMQRPSRRAYFIETTGLSSAADSPAALRYAFHGGTAAVAGMMDHSVKLVLKADLYAEDGSDWTDEDRNYFWTGNP